MVRLGFWVGIVALALILLEGSQEKVLAQSGPFEFDGPCSLTRAAQLPIEFEYKGTIPTGFDRINTANCNFTKAVEKVTVTLSGPAAHTEVFTLSEPTADVSFPLPEGTLSITTAEIVPPGEYEREMVVTSVDGDDLIISDQTSVLKTVTILPATSGPVETPKVGDLTFPGWMLAATVVLGVGLAGLGTTILSGLPLKLSSDAGQRSRF